MLKSRLCGLARDVCPPRLPRALQLFSDHFGLLTPALISGGGRLSFHLDLEVSEAMITSLMAPTEPAFCLGWVDKHVAKAGWSTGVASGVPEPQGMPLPGCPCPQC